MPKLLEKKGYDIYITGFDKLGIEKGLVSNPDYIFLPVPYKSTDGSIKTPYSEKRFQLGYIVSRYPESSYLLGGCDDTAKSIFGGTKYTDILKNETFLIRNALLTAQGALCAHLKNTESALCDQTCLVIGYGRISKFLCRLIRAYNAKIIATARKERKDLALIRAEGFEAAHTNDIKKSAAGSRRYF